MKNNLVPYFIPVNKPVGLGSTEVVRYFKSHLPKPIDKIGHIGTLDPFADGLLILGINGAQRTNEIIHDDFTKTYVAKGIFGIKTSTGDHTGEVEIQDDLSQIEFTKTKEELNQQFQNQFVGDYLQKPHKVSAAKVNGHRLYDLHRKGIEVEIQPVARKIFSLEVLELNFPEILFRVEVSSGTYVRVLFEDMAKTLGLHGHLKTLTREKIGSFELSKALTRESWPSKGEGLADEYKVGLDQVLDYPVIALDEKTAKMIQSGVRLRNEQVFVNYPQYMSGNKLRAEFVQKKFWSKTLDGELIGLFECESDVVKIVFNFRN